MPSHYLPHSLFTGGALLLATACGGGEGGQGPPPSGTFAEGWQGIEAGWQGGAETSCEPGAERSCAVTLSQANGVLHCYRGVQRCGVKSHWGACQEGQPSAEIAPIQVAPGSEESQARSMSTACADNPCDASCQWFNEGGPISPSTTPPMPPGCISGQYMCDYAVFGEQSAYVVSDGILRGDVAAGPLGITLNDGAQADSLISTGPIDTGTNATIGNIYSSYVGPADTIIVGEDTTVTGAVHGAGDVHVAGGVTVTGELRAGGALTFSSGNTTLDSTIYAGDDVYMGGGSVELWGDLHAGGAVTLTGSGKSLHGDIYSGGSLLIEGSADNDIYGNVDVAVDIDLEDGGKTISGNARAGGLVTLCPTCSAGSIQAPVAVTAPAAPAPQAPPTLPVLDTLRRDVSTVCAQARSEPDRLSGDIVVTPGIYGRVAPGWQRELRLLGGGSYVFENIELGWRDKFIFEGVGPWDITVCDNHPTLVADPRGGMMETPAFSASMGPGASFELASGGVVAPQDVTIYAAPPSGPCMWIGHVEYAGLMIAPDCEILSDFDSNGVANLWGESVWTDDDVNLSTIPHAICEQGSFWGELNPEAGGLGCPPAIIAPSTTLEVTEAYQSACDADSAVAWGLLLWEAELPGSSTIEMEFRSSANGTFSEPWTPAATLSSANGNSSCGPFSSCMVDITGLFPAWSNAQPEHLELRMRLKPDGSDVPTLNDFKLTYSCLVDQ